MPCLAPRACALLLISACSAELRLTDPDETRGTTDAPPTGTGAPEVTTSGEAATDASTGGDTTDAPTGGDTTDAPTGDETSGGPVEALAGLELMTRLAGLWTGSATMTVLGDFPRMNMDLRAASPHVLFGRVDLDPDNSLRFAWSVETHGGGDVLVFRNGGQFMGLDRDTRTTLVEHDAGVGRYRFCAVDGGCDYIDAVFDLDADDHLLLDVAVKGAPHLLWDATRREVRELPAPFPADASAQGTGDAPFPGMPALRVTVSWGEPLAAAADVWAILTTEPCDLQLKCTHSRSLRVTAPAGATSAELAIAQVHAGEYQLNAILDHDQNVADTLAPGPGDGVGLPNKAVVVAPQGETAAGTAIVFTFP